MPVYVKSGSYTLGTPFVAGGGYYNQVDADNLRLWIRFLEAPVDGSSSSLSISPVGTPDSVPQQIPSPEISRIPDLPALRFKSASSEYLSVAATSQLDFSGGKPFTIACWVRHTDLSTAFVAAMPNAAASDNGWTVYTKGTINPQSAVFTLEGTGGGYITARTGAIIFQERWHHVAITYDGSNTGEGVRIYVDGTQADVTVATVGTFTALDVDSTGVLKVGANYDGSANRWEGDLAELGIWAAELSENKVKALYHSTAGRYYAKSGVISRPNRVRIRDEDNRQGSYPRQLRTTGKSLERGNDPVKFDDSKIQIFREFDDARFPLVTNDSSLENLDLGNLIASPNQNSNLISIGTAAGLLTTQGTYVLDSEPPVSISPFDESAIFLKDKSDSFYGTGVSSNDYPGYSSPLKDKIAIRVPISSKEEKTLTRYSGYRIESDPDGLFENTFSSTGFYYFNFNQSRWEDIGLHPNYPMYYSGSDSSPFSCVSLGSEIKDSGTGIHETAADAGTGPKVQQFKMSDHTGNFLDSAFDTARRTPSDPYSELTSSLGYHLIGAPTQTGLAPWHRKYHATGSQTFSISDYITGDFLLEKAVINIPVIVQRMRGHSLNPQLGSSRYSDTCRDIDNYVFFLYRQRRATTKGATIDSEYEKDMSRRDLVCSGSATFFNSNAFSGRVPAEIRSRGLPHTPAFSYDFELSPAVVSPDSELISSFTGSIRIEMKVANPVGQAVGGSRFPLAGAYQSGLGGSFLLPVKANSPIRSVVTQDWWTRDREIFSASLATNSQFNDLQCFSQPFTGFSNYLAGLAPFAAAQKTSAVPRSIETLGNDRLLRDPRGLKSAVGVGKYYFVDYTSRSNRSQGRIETFGVNQDRDLGFYGYTTEYDKENTNMPILFGSYPSSTPSPFVFEPGDEIILGVDAGISMLPAGFNNTIFGGATVNTADELGHYIPNTPPTFACMSGSFMKILTEGASLTLFGSQIKRDRQVLVSSNQMLTSDAIHESIGDAQVLDQFDVPSRLDLSGSYVDRLMFGSVTPSDAIVSDTNAVTIEEKGLNAINNNSHGSSTYKFNRSTVSFFSRNWTGISPFIALSPGTDHWSTIYHDKSTGYPPRFDRQPGYDDSVYKWIITNTAATGEGDPYYVTPRKAAVFSDTNIVSLQRFITIPDSGETYYDSMAPDVVDFASRATARIPEPTVRSIPSLGATPAQAPTIRIWAGNMHKLSEYPYQGNPVRHKDQEFVAHIIPDVGPDASLDPGATTGTLVNSRYAGKLLRSTLFNRGFRYSQDPSAHDRGFVYPLLTGSHGPSYGMISPVVARPTARFRRDRYGQLRDMLEQRPDTKFYVDSISGQGSLGFVANSPVQIKFVDSSDGGTIVDPFSTDSQNCSTEYTSSIPYTDGESSYTPDGEKVIVLSRDGTGFDFSLLTP